MLDRSFGLGNQAPNYSALRSNPNQETLGLATKPLPV